MTKIKEEFVCHKCKGKRIQVMDWVNPNTEPPMFIGGIELADIDDSMTWCEDCEDNTGIDLVETFL